MQCHKISEQDDWWTFKERVIPFKRSELIIITHLIDVVGFNKDLVYGTDYAASHQIYSISSPPSTLGWSSAYAKDPRTTIILPIL